MTTVQANVAKVPVVAIGMSTVAGALVIANSLLWIINGSFLKIPLEGINQLGVLSIVATGIVIGLIILFSAYRLSSTPGQHESWGAAIALLSVLSLVFATGGFIVGFFLGVAGGLLAVLNPRP